MNLDLISLVFVCGFRACLSLISLCFFCYCFLLKECFLRYVIEALRFSLFFSFLVLIPSQDLLPHLYSSSTPLPQSSSETHPFFSLWLFPVLLSNVRIHTLGPVAWTHVPENPDRTQLPARSLPLLAQYFYFYFQFPVFISLYSIRHRFDLAWRMFLLFRNPFQMKKYPYLDLIYKGFCLIYVLFPHSFVVCLIVWIWKKKRMHAWNSLFYFFIFIPLLFAFAISSYIFGKYKLRKNWHVDLVEYLWRCVSNLIAILNWLFLLFSLAGYDMQGNKNETFDRKRRKIVMNWYILNILIDILRLYVAFSFPFPSCQVFESK